MTVFKKEVLLILLLLLVSLQLGVLLVVNSTLFLSKEAYFNHLADKVIAICSAESYAPTCYDLEVPKLMDDISMEEAFEVTKIIQLKDPNYWYCHVLGHNLSAREVAKDPANWKNVLRRCPSGVCSNGCLHGGLQERFRDDVLTEDQIQTVVDELENLCEEKDDFHPTGLEQASCYHAIGHLTMYIASADPDRAVAICDEIALKSDGRSFLRTCYEGAYMQIFQPLEPEDFALVEGLTPEREELRQFCAKYEGDRFDACWREGWPLFVEDIKTPEGLITFCTYTSNPEKQRHCYNAMFYVLTAQFGFDQSKIVSFCQSLPPDISSQCFANAASREIETDYRLAPRAVELCETADADGIGDQCFEELIFYSTFNYHPGSVESTELCQAMPGEWAERCLQEHTNAN